MLPEYDKERVYVSDIKKVLKWYNLLLEKELLDFTEEEIEEEVKGAVKEEVREKEVDKDKKEETK